MSRFNSFFNGAVDPISVYEVGGYIPFYPIPERPDKAFGIRRTYKCPRDIWRTNMPVFGSTDAQFSDCYLVSQSEAVYAGFGEVQFTREFITVPTFYYEPSTYALNYYIVSANKVGWNKTGFVPDGAKQVFDGWAEAGLTGPIAPGQTQVIVNGFAKWDKVTVFSGDGIQWTGSVTVRNTSSEAIRVSIWFVRAGTRVALNANETLSSRIRHDFFRVGAGTAYADAINIPIYQEGQSYDGMTVAEPSSLTQFNGPIWRRATRLIANNKLVREFQYGV